jgi:hypothetical protein
MTLSASDVYALAHGTRNSGDEECHWCASKCGRLWKHDEPPPVPFIRTITTSLRRANLYICVGCWLWRRKSTTANYLEGGQRDRQEAQYHSWLFTPEGAWVVRPESLETLRERLLKPPLRFVLALLDGPRQANVLQLLKANDVPEVQAATPLVFTINNIPHTYTVYELAEAIKTGDANGCEPGTAALLRILGLRKQSMDLTDADTLQIPEPPKRGRGRPKPLDTAPTVLGKVISASGMPAA